MTLDEIKDLWKQDAQINRTKLLEEISRIPLLHSKYLEFMIEFRAKHARAQSKLNHMKNLKRRYYRGELTQKELLDNNWQQWQGLKPSSSELNQLFEQDPDLIDLTEKLEYWSTALTTVEYIMRAIQSRGYEMKTMVDYIKFEAGG